VEHDPLARLRMFPGSVAEQVIALTDLWKSRSQRTFVAMRERMNALEDLQLELEPAAFDNYFRRSNREKTPEEVVWALIRVMRDDDWLPQAQQSMLAEALYLAALKNVSVLTYARIYLLFPGQEDQFYELCPLGGLIAEYTQQIRAGAGDPSQPATTLGTGENTDRSRSEVERFAICEHSLWGSTSPQMKYLILAVLVALAMWTVLTSVGMTASTPTSSRSGQPAAGIASKLAMAA